MILPCVWALGIGCTRIRVYVCVRTATIMCFWVENLFKQILLTPDGVRTSLAPLVFNVFIEAGYGGAFNSLCNGALGACTCSDGVNWGRRMFSWTLEEYDFPLTFPRGGSTVFFSPHLGWWSVLITCCGTIDLPQAVLMLLFNWNT